MPKCPECDANVGKADAACKTCGAELGAIAPPPPPREPSNAQQYGIIIGVIVVVAALLIFVSSAMGSTKCKECKAKGVTTCVVCKGQTPKCQNCKGSGSDPQTFSTCAMCGGKGTAQVCYNCKGTWKRACRSCNGSGSVK